MKTLKPVFSVLFTFSLCAGSVSCARQNGAAPPPVSEPASAAVWQTETEPSDTAQSEPVTEPPSEETSEETSEPTTAKPATTVKCTKKAVDPIAAFEAEALRLVNAERRAIGVAELESSEELHAGAKIRAGEIRQSFSHTRPDGQSCFSVNPDLIMGENIAMGQESPQEAVEAWMNSPSHREILLLDRFTISAVGCYYDKANDTYYWVQLFG